MTTEIIKASELSNALSIPFDKIVFDESIQPRSQTNSEVIDQYAELLKNKVNLPLPEVFEATDGRYYIGDGWHRIIAHGLAFKKEPVPCLVHPGGREAALRTALKANTTHGLRRSNADKRKAVCIALHEFPKYSDRRIAELCSVSHIFVGKLRKQVETFPPARIGKDGKQYPIVPGETPEPEQLVLSFKEEYCRPLRDASKLLWNKTNPDPRIQYLSKADFEELREFHYNEAVRLRDLIREMEAGS